MRRVRCAEAGLQGKVVDGLVLFLRQVRAPSQSPQEASTLQIISCIDVLARQLSHPHPGAHSP